MADLPSPVAIVGGTGALGRGLAIRWSRAGLDLILGSRDAARARAAAEAIGGAVTGAANPDAAAAAALVVLAVPFAAHAETLAAVRDAVQGKIVVDATVPLVPPRVSRVQLPEGYSAALMAQEFLGPDVRVVAAFHNVAAAHLADPGHEIDCDVLVCGDDRDARETVIALAAAAGMHALHAGPLANAVAVESLTALLIWMNRHYKVPGAGLRITGLAQAGG